jgi:hypothetical protein
MCSTIVHELVDSEVVSTKSHGQLCPNLKTRVFVKTSPKRSYSLNRKRAFWLVFAKTGSIISGTNFSAVSRSFVYNVQMSHAQVSS